MENILNKYNLFWEKWRPTKLEDLYLPKRIINGALNGILDNNILLSGSSGLGKTTLVSILIKNFDYIYINASSEASIDTLRGKILDFCKIRIPNPKSNIKIVWLEEFDRSSSAFQDALRAFIEQWSNITHFISTCNYPDKIEPTVLSRFTLIDVTVRPDEKKERYINMAKCLNRIALEESIDISKDIIKEIVKRSFPDYRSALNLLQAYSYDHHIVKNYEGDFETKIQNCVLEFKNEMEVFSILEENCITDYDYRAAMNALSMPLVKRVIDMPQYISKIPQLCIIISKYTSTKHIDPLVGLAAMIFELSINLKNKK